MLLVEDELQLRELLVHVLSDKGYNVISAANGPEALQKASEHSGKIDLLVTDVIMPEMRGQDLAEELVKRSPGLLVMYMSGYTDNALVHSGALPGGTNFLQKPFTPDLVLRRVRQVLDEATQARRVQRKAM